LSGTQLEELKDIRGCKLLRKLDLSQNPHLKTLPDSFWRDWENPMEIIISEDMASLIPETLPSNLTFTRVPTKRADLLIEKYSPPEVVPLKKKNESFWHSAIRWSGLVALGAGLAALLVYVFRRFSRAGFSS
jgi:hypothetical protein